MGFLNWISENFGAEKRWNQISKGRMEPAKAQPKQYRKQYKTAEDIEAEKEAKAAARDAKRTEKARQKFSGTIAKLEKKGTKVAKLLEGITIEKEIAGIHVVEGKIRSHMINVRSLPAVFRGVLKHIRELRADPINYLGPNSSLVVQVERDVHAAVRAMDAIDLVYSELGELGEIAEDMKKELDKVRKAVKPFKAVDAEMRSLYTQYIEPRTGRAPPTSEVPKGQRFA